MPHNRKPRVRVGRSYAHDFNILHGQKEFRIIQGPTNPLQRIHRRLDVVSVHEPGYDLLHTFNSIPILTKTPFVVTYESLLPRLIGQGPILLFLPFLTKRLASDQCRKIISMSQYAVRQMRAQHSDSPLFQSLLPKIEIVYPGIPKLASNPKPMGNSPIQLLFVGNDFFRKGGPALLAAHKRLLNKGIKIQTTIVSSLSWSMSDYVGPPDPAYVESELRDLSHAGVIFHRRMANEDLRQLMRLSDYLVLPTLHDTFGYVALEAMSAGTPVISTNTCVQPEIIENEISGFLLPFENDDEIGKWVHIGEISPPKKVELYRLAIEKLSLGLCAVLEKAMDSSQSYLAMSDRALFEIDQRFSKEVARQKLEAIYSAACYRK